MAAADSHGCSARSKRLLKPMLSYIGEFIRAQQEGLWDAKARPDGWIPLVVAENKLGNHLVLERLEAVRDFPAAVMNYSGMKGIPELQASMARLLERFVLPGHSVNPEHLCISSGCSAILDNLIYVICDDGDGILIPAPYYPAFDNDLQAKCCVHPVPFFLAEPVEGGLSVREQLDAAVQEAASFGIPIRGLLVTNPNNPLGTLYSEATIREALRWCLDNNVHYISDEIYALSVFKEGARFTSAVTLAQQLVAPQASAAAAAAAAAGTGSGAAAAADGGASDGSAAGGGAGGSGNGAAADGGDGAAADGGDGAAADGGAASSSYSQRQVDRYVHLVYGLSKDWCASGLRVGLLYSRNQRLQQSLNPIAVFGSVSNHTQWALAQVLDDQEWAEGFLRQNCQLLEQSYDAMAGALEAEGIPFEPAVAGMFVWVDLRRWLAEPTWEAELEFWQQVCEKCKVIMTPGRDCHAAEPGFFRLCFAWMPPQALPEAVRRLKLQLAASAGASAASDCTVQ